MEHETKNHNLRENILQMYTYVSNPSKILIFTNTIKNMCIILFSIVYHDFTRLICITNVPLLLACKTSVITTFGHSNAIND